MYHVFMDKMELPIAPDVIQTKINNKNDTVVLLNEGEISIPRKPGLSTFTFKMRIPHFKLPYSRNLKSVKYYLNYLERLKINKEIFQFIVTREWERGKKLYNSNIKCTLETYTIDENASNGRMTVIDIELKAYQNYVNKVVKIKEDKSGKKKVSTKKKRDDGGKRNPKNKTINYTVKQGDTLWGIARRYYGDGSKYTKIYNANKSKIKNPHWIYPGQVFKIEL